MLEFNKKLQEKFTQMSQTGKLFRSELAGQQVWDLYIGSFTKETNPIFRDPLSTSKNCNHCKNFIRRYGNIVSIDENYEIVTMFDVDADSEYENTAKVLSKAIKSSTGKVDLLTFDACLMGSAEVLYEIKDVANVIVGSQDSTLGTGLLYTKALPGIISSSKNIDEIGRNIVLASDRQGKDFLRRPNKKGNVPNVFTLAAYKGSLIKPFVNELNSLSKLLISKIPSQKQAIKQAINGSSPMNVDGDDLGGQRDIYEILGRLNTIITDSQVKDSITKTRNNLNKSILISRTHNSEKNAQGMAINISASSVSSDDYKNTAFAKETSWDELILAINK